MRDCRQILDFAEVFVEPQFLHYSAHTKEHKGVSTVTFIELISSSGASAAIEFTDVVINCIDCHQDFIWTGGEQLFFYDKGLKNPPKRCKGCKLAKNERIAAINISHNAEIKQKIEVSVNCASCETATTVPFYPSQNRPVYCRSCFLKRKDEG